MFGSSGSKRDAAAMEWNEMKGKTECEVCYELKF